jgi:hypothetical protein
MIMFFINNFGGGGKLTPISSNSIASTFRHAKTHLAFQHYITHTAAGIIELNHKGLYITMSPSTGSWASGSNNQYYQALKSF